MIKPMLPVIMLAEFGRFSRKRCSFFSKRMPVWRLAFCLLTGLQQAQGAAPSNDDCLGAQLIQGPFPWTTALVDVTEATVSTNDPPISNPDLVGKVAKSVWYRFTP